MCVCACNGVCLCIIEIVVSLLDWIEMLLTNCALTEVGQCERAECMSESWKER